MNLLNIVQKRKETEKQQVIILLLKKTKIEAYSESIFINYNYVGESEYDCENIASAYVTSIIKNKVIDMYQPLNFQNKLMSIFNNIGEVKLSVIDVPVEKIVSALNEMVKTQEVFRTTYDKTNNIMKVHEYSEVTFPIIKNIDEDKWKSSLYDTYKQMCLYEENLLSRIFIEIADDKKINIYFLFDHSISDDFSKSILLGLFKNILKGNKNEYLPLRKFSDMIKHKKKLKDDINLYNVETLYRSVINFNNAFDNYKYALIKVEKICSAEEIEKINNNPMDWYMRKMLNMFPDEFCKQIENKIPFMLLHHGRTSLDYQTLGMFLSCVAGIYDDESIGNLMSKIRQYQIDDLDIPDIMEFSVENDENINYSYKIPIVNIQTNNDDLHIDENSISFETIDEFVTLNFLIINGNQIKLWLPTVYNNTSDLKEKISSNFKFIKKGE